MYERHVDHVGHQQVVVGTVGDELLELESVHLLEALEQIGVRALGCLRRRHVHAAPPIAAK